MDRAFWSRLTPLFAALAMAACGKPESSTDVAQAGPDPKACADPAGPERLKARVFAQAADVRTGDAGSLPQLAGAAAVRIEQAAAKSRDDALGVTVCKGRLVVELPPGAQDAFSGDRRLTADVEYAVQTAPNGGPRVHLLSGAEPIAYRLAAIGLKSDSRLASAPAVPARPRAQQAERPTQGLRRVAMLRERPARSWSGREPRLTSRGRPSFNCRGSRTRQERMICTDERLAALDRVAVSLYREAMDNSGRETRAALRGTGAEFAARRAACRNPSCIAEAYQDRMDQIDRIASVDD